MFEHEIKLMEILRQPTTGFALLGAGSSVYFNILTTHFCVLFGGEMAQRLEREFTDRKVRGSNPTSASRLPLSRLGQPGSTVALVLPSGGMAAGH
ncbi:hypothetical protein CSKR_105468 [Clonorchis sinensis]|uniref:Uncharacterized protein n=1 Tax=Clonorchis sinensis TaxID=79923 RepID=A0A3R7C692_CLOSI|nr:hypothetical protein CSKR_105468 [Clonorchis sinensis]